MDDKGDHSINKYILEIPWAVHGDQIDNVEAQCTTQWPNVKCGGQVYGVMTKCTILRLILLCSGQVYFVVAYHTMWYPR